MNQVKKKCLQVVVVALVQQLSHMAIYYTRCKKGNLQRIFVVATGALLSPIMMQQKETIPTIAHGVVFERVKGE